MKYTRSPCTSLMPVLAWAGISCLPLTAHASPIVFSGGDPGANSTDPRPLSDATAAAFDTAAGGLGPLHLIDFEAVPVGPFESLTVAPGVTLTGSAVLGLDQSILTVSPFGSPDSVYGYDTTPGGDQFLWLFGGSVTFTFDTPIQAFGAYFSGVQNVGETILFDDGSSQSIILPDLGGGVEFVGFLDAGKEIVSVTIDTVSPVSLGDYIGIDDVRFVPIPEPGSALLLALGLACVARATRAIGKNRILPMAK